ncbi:MAG: hypothetical protein AAGJ94_12970 [Pseudomonadota bacterium]
MNINKGLWTALRADILSLGEGVPPSRSLHLAGGQVCTMTFALRA